jgi:hypothetical protein
VAKEEGSEEAATEEPIDARECTASSYSPPRKRPFPMQTPVTHLDTQLQPNHPQIEFSRPQSLVGSRCHCDSFRDLSAHTHILILSALYLQPCIFSLVSSALYLQPCIFSLVSSALSHIQTTKPATINSFRRPDHDISFFNSLTS